MFIARRSSERVVPAKVIVVVLLFHSINTDISIVPPLRPLAGQRFSTLLGQGRFYKACGMIMKLLESRDKFKKEGRFYRTYDIH